MEPKKMVMWTGGLTLAATILTLPLRWTEAMALLVCLGLATFVARKWASAEKPRRYRPRPDWDYARMTAGRQLYRAEFKTEDGWRIVSYYWCKQEHFRDLLMSLEKSMTPHLYKSMRLVRDNQQQTGNHRVRFYQKVH